jgi:hypothetical protein
MSNLKLVIDGVDLDSAEQALQVDALAWVEERARLGAKWRAEEIERRILAGENRIEIPAGGYVRHREIYTVPTWRREPIKRLRIEWARLKARR